MLTFLFTCVLSSHPQDTPAKWDAVSPLVGVWTGKCVGESGAGQTERSYRMVMNNRFLEVRSKTVFPPKAGQQSGEVHEDWGMFNFNKTRGKLMLREFHVEGFVNQYVLIPAEPGSSKLVFESESIDNVPAGFRAKHILQFVSKDEIKEEFFLAEPGKEFQIYSTTTLHRNAGGSK
jgi:hypothetical protein